MASILFTLVALLIFTWVTTASVNEGTVPANTTTTTYQVQPGDTVYSIAEHFDPNADYRAVSEWITQHDGVHDGLIQPGQVLEVPVTGGK